MLRSSLPMAALVALCGCTATAQDAAPALPPAPAIPDTADGVAPGPDGYILESIGDRLWWIGNGFYQAMLIEGPDGVALVDAPTSMAEIIEPAIVEATGGRALTHLVYSHGHGDHIGAAGLFAPAGSGVEIVAHEETARQIARGGPCLDCADIDDPRPAPTVTFTDRYRLDLGEGQVLELAYDGPNHQDGNSFVHAPKQRTLMLVDVAYPGWVPFDLLAISSDIPGWLAAYEGILDYDFDTFLGGHLGRAGTRADVEIVKDYIEDVERAAVAALTDMDRGAFVGKVGQQIGFRNAWALFDAYSEEIAARCAASVEADWTGRLGGVETFTHKNCLRMQYSSRVD